MVKDNVNVKIHLRVLFPEVNNSIYGLRDCTMF